MSPLTLADYKAVSDIFGNAKFNELYAGFALRLNVLKNDDAFTRPLPLPHLSPNNLRIFHATVRLCLLRFLWENSLDNSKFDVSDSEPLVTTVLRGLGHRTYWELRSLLAHSSDMFNDFRSRYGLQFVPSPVFGAYIGTANPRVSLVAMDDRLAIPSPPDSVYFYVCNGGDSDYIRKLKRFFDVLNNLAADWEVRPMGNTPNPGDDAAITNSRDRDRDRLFLSLHKKTKIQNVVAVLFTGSKDADKDDRLDNIALHLTRAVLSSSTEMEVMLAYWHEMRAPVVDERAFC